MHDAQSYMYVLQVRLQLQDFSELLVITNKRVADKDRVWGTTRHAVQLKASRTWPGHKALARKVVPSTLSNGNETARSERVSADSLQFAL
jgi:hypothetical protein